LVGFSKYDWIGSTFVLLCILFAVPTWYVHKIEDDISHFFVIDFSELATISLIPLMAYKIVKNWAIKWFCLSYFYLTLTNLFSLYLQYIGTVSINVLRIQIIGLMIILLWFVIRIRKHGLY
jgi:hypothetical protein